MTTWEKLNFENNYFAAAKGEVEGSSFRNVFGFSDGIGTSYVTPWELASTTQYVFPPTALTMSLVSDSASDTAVSILISGLDADYNQISEIVALNGTTPVTTVRQYKRINDLVTTSGNAVGNVSATNGGVTYARIRAGVGRNQACLFTVPAGHTFYLCRIDAFSATASGSKYISYINKNTLFNGTSYRVAETTFTNIMHIQRQTPFPVQEKTDLEFQVKFSSSTGEVGIFAEGLLVRNNTTHV